MERRESQPEGNLPSNIDALEWARTEVEFHFRTLTPVEVLVLRHRFGLEDGQPKSFKQVGEIIEKSKSTAWRVERQALSKLRSPVRSKTPLVDSLVNRTAEGMAKTSWAGWDDTSK